MVNKPAIEWKNLSTGCLVAITQGLVFAVRSIGPLPASHIRIYGLYLRDGVLHSRLRALNPWRCHSKCYIQSQFHIQCLILVSMSDVQSQISNFMFGLSFHTLMMAPSSEAGKPYPRKLGKGLPCL